MHLSEMIRRKRESQSFGYNKLAEKYGFHRNALHRWSEGLQVFPQPDAIHRLAEFLGTREVYVVLAAAEELGVYSPEKDGRFRAKSDRPELPEDVESAVATLEHAIANHLTRP